MFSLKRILFLLPPLFAVCFCQEKPHRGPSRAPIATTAPKLAGGTSATEPIPGPFLKNFKPPPYPTDSWWAGLTLGKQTNLIAGPFPFESQTGNDGFYFGIGKERNFDGKTVRVKTKLELIMSIAKLPVSVSNRKATGWDTQTVSLVYTADDASTMATTLVPGSPYMTFKFTKAQVIIKPFKGLINFNWDSAGKKGKVTLDGNVVYALYVVDGTLNQFTLVNNVLTFSAGFTGTIRLAKIDIPAQEAVLDAHSLTYPTALTMKYEIVGDQSTQTWTWDVVGDPSKLLILCWPHHRKVLVAPTYVDIEYLNIKGRMRGVVGNQWIQRHNLPPIKWDSTLKPHASCVAEINRTLEYEVRTLWLGEPNEFYVWGRTCGRAATIANIAESLGRTDLRQKVIDKLKASINLWFVPGRSTGAAYETRWGGVVGLTGKNNRHYNDHHFLFGYMLYVGSIIGKYDPAWIAKNIDFFNSFARDIGNPSPDDPYFTVARHMDFFAGHSWASGLLDDAGPRNQESSSEAINGYYSLILFGDVTKNAELVKWGRLLLAMEIMGAQTYWHLYPNVIDPDTPYPEPEFKKLGTVGNLYANGAGAYVLFPPGRKVQVAAIEILPLTRMGELFYDAEWMKGVIPYCQSEFNIPEADVWKSVIVAAYAVVDPRKAYAYSSDITLWGDGNSATNQIYFVATQPVAGTGPICSNPSYTPEGLFLIQDVKTGNYVTGFGPLKANYASLDLATKFELAYVPGGGTIVSKLSNKYLTARRKDFNGLTANAQYPGETTTFRWKSNGDGYVLTAMANRKTIYTATNGLLSNDGKVATPSNYRLIPTTGGSSPELPTQGKLQSVHTSRFVMTIVVSKVLNANAPTKELGSTFTFERVLNTELYVIRFNGLAVTADPNTQVTLRATKPEAKSWENFIFIRQNDAYILVHEFTGNFVEVQADGTLLNNGTQLGTRSLYKIVV